MESGRALFVFGTWLLAIAALPGFVQERHRDVPEEFARWRVVHAGGTAGAVQLLALRGARTGEREMMEGFIRRQPERATALARRAVPDRPHEKVTDDPVVAGDRDPNVLERLDDGGAHARFLANLACRRLLRRLA